MTTGSVLKRTIVRLLSAQSQTLSQPTDVKNQNHHFLNFVHHRVQTKPRPPKLLNYNRGTTDINESMIGKKGF